MSKKSKHGGSQGTLFHSGLIAALIGFGLYFDNAAIDALVAFPGTSNSARVAPETGPADRLFRSIAGGDANFIAQSPLLPAARRAP